MKFIADSVNDYIPSILMMLHVIFRPIQEGISSGCSADEAIVITVIAPQA